MLKASVDNAMESPGSPMSRQLATILEREALRLRAAVGGTPLWAGGASRNQEQLQERKQFERKVKHFQYAADNPDVTPAQLVEVMDDITDEDYAKTIVDTVQERRSRHWAYVTLESSKTKLKARIKITHKPRSTEEHR
jgi:hypothetical protein